MKNIWFIMALLLLIGNANAQSKQVKRETLIFDGYYNWGFIWVNVANVEINTYRSEKYDGSRKIVATCATNPSGDWIFKLRDTLVSYNNMETYFPYEFSRKAHEGNYHKTFDYKIDYEQACAHAVINRIGRYIKLDTIPLKKNTYDMLSIAWKMREVDFDKLRKNDTIPLNVLIDDEVSNIYIRYLGVDKVKIEGNKRDCYKFSCLLIDGDVFNGGEGMNVWISKDADRIPVMVEAKILIGSIKGILRSVEIKYEK